MTSGRDWRVASAKLGQAEAELGFDTLEGGGGQAVAAHVVRVGRQHLVRGGLDLRALGTPVESERQD